MWVNKDEDLPTLFYIRVTRNWVGPNPHRTEQAHLSFRCWCLTEIMIKKKHVYSSKTRGPTDTWSMTSASKKKHPFFRTMLISQSRHFSSLFAQLSSFCRCNASGPCGKRRLPAHHTARPNLWSMWKNSKNYLWPFLYSLYSLKNFSIPVWDAEGEGRVTDCFVLSYFYELPCICWLLGKFMANTGLPSPSGLKKNCTRTNVGEGKKKKTNGWHASYKHADLQMLSGSPGGARKLADVRSPNVLMTTLKQALKLQKSLIKKGGLRGNHFLFQRGFCLFVLFYLLGIFLGMNWERISSYKQTASSF